MNIPLVNDWYKRARSDRRYTKFLTVDQWFKCCTTIIYNEIYNKHQCQSYLTSKTNIIIQPLQEYVDSNKH